MKGVPVKTHVYRISMDEFREEDIKECAECCYQSKEVVRRAGAVLGVLGLLIVGAVVAWLVTE